MDEQTAPNSEVIVVSPEKLQQLIENAVYAAVRRALEPQDEASEQSNYLNQAQAAKLLDVSVATVRRWWMSGKLKDVIKIGRTVRYSKAELLNMKEGEQ